MDIKERPIDEEMKNSYLDYAMSVIVSRAIPDVRDGLKPVHRRILYGMYQLGLHHNKPYKKSARIVGEVMGKYHPHGDQAIYNTLARMAQDFSMRYLLVDGQGNFGSIDGDAPAAMRYTEARLSKIAEEMLQDIDMETVDFMPNFDGTLKEPLVLPSRVPNLLINGSSGIAVGMATNMPPHNLSEIVDAMVYLIDNPDAAINDLLKFVKGPDFPTGGKVTGYGGLVEAYTTGRGKIKISAKYEIKDKSIIINEIPYGLNKSNILKKIAALVRDGKLNGISDLKDESDRDGIRIVIKVKRDFNPEVVVNQLMEHTDLEVTYGIINLVLVDGVPKVLNLKELMREYINHRMSVLIRKSKFRLEKDKERKHILDGLIRALSIIDEVIATIKASKDVKEAHANLVNMGFSDIQAKAILEMRLQKLTSMEINALKEEAKKLEEEIEYLEKLLSDEKMRYDVIKDELIDVKNKYGDKRRTEIVYGEVDRRTLEELIPQGENVVIISERGYVKRISLDEYKVQHRGGKGLMISYGDDDLIRDVVKADTHDYLLFFTASGKVFSAKAYEIPEGSRRSKGRAIVNILPKIDSPVIRMISVKDFQGILFFVTKKGIVKRTYLSEFSNIRSNGMRAINFDEDDEIVDVMITNGDSEVMIFTKYGQAIRFDEDDVRIMGRTARGVHGIRLRDGDEVVSAGLSSEGKYVFAILTDGHGKRTIIDEYRKIKRGGFGVKNIETRNASVVKSIMVDDDSEVIVLTKNGMSIRFPVKNIRVMGRNAHGVKLINLENNDEVINAARVK